MILRFQGGSEVEHRAFALTDMVKWGYDGLRYTPGTGTPVGNAQAVPAINRAARLRAEAVASLQLRCYRGDGPAAQRVDTVWQAQLFAQPAYNEYQTRFDFWETVEESLAYRGNGYVWKLKDMGRVIEPWALHPDQVTCLGGDQYRVRMGGRWLDPVGRGPATYVVDTGTIWHIRGHGNGGTVEAPSPVQVFKEALQAPMGRMRHENRMWKRGTALQQVVTFPPGVTPQQAEQWKPQWAANYEGTDGDTTGVLGGGATLTSVGMTLADAQFVEMARLTREDASLMMGVPANLLGAQLQRSVPNLEQDLATWLRFGLGTELARIETSLAADPDFFPPLSQTEPRFDTNGFVRGDLITESNIAHQKIQDGRLLPDEARAQEGLPPLPGGVGMIPQVTPVGGAPNPVGMIPSAFNPTPIE
jgi:HK97 family phage portal protein